MAQSKVIMEKEEIEKRAEELYPYDNYGLTTKSMAHLKRRIYVAVFTEAYNLAVQTTLKDVAENAEIIQIDTWYNNRTNIHEPVFGINKSSILSRYDELKIK